MIWMHRIPKKALQEWAELLKRAASPRINRGNGCDPGIRMLRHVLAIFVLATLINSRTRAEEAWTLHLLVLPCQSYPGDRSEDAASRMTQVLQQALEKVGRTSQGQIYEVIPKHDVESAARRLGLPVPDKERPRVDWNAEAVARLAHEVNADTLVESHCSVRERYDGRFIVEAALQFREVASHDCILQAAEAAVTRSVEGSVQRVGEDLGRKCMQTLLTRATVQGRRANQVEIHAGARNGVQVGERFFVTRQIQGHPVMVGHLRAVRVGPDTTQAEVVDETAAIAAHDTVTVMYPDAFTQTPEEIRVNVLVAATTQITLERTECYGSCPVYTVTLDRNGRVTYVGEKYVKRKGRFLGHIEPGEFDRLAEIIEKLAFFQLDDDYSVRSTDLPSTLVTVERAGSKKTVSDYGNAAPVAFWGMATLIDDVVSGITEWTKETSRKARPGKGE